MAGKTTRSKKLQAVKEEAEDVNIGGTKLDLKDLEKAGFTLLKDSTYAEVKDSLPTGLPALDLTMNGGIPFGRVTQLFAENAVGKSTMAIQLIRQAIGMGVWVVLIDVEGTAQGSKMERMGVDTSKVLIKEASKKDPEGLSIESIGETIESAIELLAKHDEPVLFIWDSVGASISRKTMSDDFDSERPGVQAKAITKVIQKVAPQFTTSNSALLILNQVRSNIQTGFGGGYGPTVSFPGGKNLEHALSLNYQMVNAGQVTRSVSVDGKQTRVLMGNKVKFKNKKSKVSPRNQEATQFLYGDLGFNEMVNVIFTAEELKMVKVTSAGGKKIKVPNKDTGEVELFPYWEFLDYIATEEGAEEYMYFLKPLFQGIVKHYFPEEFPPLNNVHINISNSPLYEGIEDIYKEEPAEEKTTEETEDKTE